jgi:hypothetical protein
LLFIGRFLADPTDVPTEVVDYLAEQLDIADPSCVKAYRVREMTRLEHATQIRDAYGFVEYTEAAEGAGAVGGRPGCSTTGTARRPFSTGRWSGCGNTRCCCPGCPCWPGWVARGPGNGDERLWDTLAALTAAQATALEQLLEIPAGARTSDLERLRRGGG